MWVHGKGHRASGVPATQLSPNPTPLPRGASLLVFCMFLTFPGSTGEPVPGGRAAWLWRALAGKQQRFPPGLGSGQAYSLPFLGRWSRKFCIVFQFSLCPSSFPLLSWWCQDGDALVGSAQSFVQCLYKSSIKYSCHSMIIFPFPPCTDLNTGRSREWVFLAKLSFNQL